MGAWVKLQREGSETPTPEPLVTIRRGGVAFNAPFVRLARVLDKTRASVHVDADSLRIGFKFHDDAADPDSYALTHDGGGRGDARWIQATTLIHEPWVAAVARLPQKRLRRFTPVWSSVDAMWVVELCPAFEIRASAASEIPSDVRGVYRYCRGDDIVYIGRGVVRSRFGAPERAEWDFGTIEWSVVLGEDQQRHWESYWLDKYVEKHGKLPFYNRIRGASKSGVAEG